MRSFPHPLPESLSRPQGHVAERRGSHCHRARSASATVSASKAFARHVVDDHIRNCIGDVAPQSMHLGDVVTPKKEGGIQQTDIPGDSVTPVKSAKAKAKGAGRGRGLRPRKGLGCGSGESCGTGGRRTRSQGAPQRPEWPSRSPLRECGNESSLGSASKGSSSTKAGIARRRKPEWDHSASDLTRYQLSPAEQLRRQLLRISKHQDEAAGQLHRKLQNMQENIEPFVHQMRADELIVGDLLAPDVVPAQAEAHSSMVTAIGHQPMRSVGSTRSPCFASRTPTGRLPEPSNSSVLTRGHRVSSAGSQAAPPESGISRLVVPLSFPCTNTKGISPAVCTDLKNEESLDVALEAEINSFMTAERSSRQQAETELELGARDTLSIQGAGGRDEASSPRYRFLRRSPAVLAQAEASPLAVQRNCLSTPGSIRDSDAELGDIEENAAQLEKQLAWWRKQRDILGPDSEATSAQVSVAVSETSGQVGATASPQFVAQSDELTGCSEWLRLSKAAASSSGTPFPRKAGMPSTDGAVPNLPVFEPPIRQQLRQQEEEDARVRKDLHGPCSSLSEIVARQAEELFREDIPASNVGKEHDRQQKEQATEEASPLQFPYPGRSFIAEEDIDRLGSGHVKVLDDFVVPGKAASSSGNTTKGAQEEPPSPLPPRYAPQSPGLTGAEMEDFGIPPHTTGVLQSNTALWAAPSSSLSQNNFAQRFPLALAVHEANRDVVHVQKRVVVSAGPGLAGSPYAKRSLIDEFVSDDDSARSSALSADFSANVQVQATTMSSASSRSPLAAEIALQSEASSLPSVVWRSEALDSEVCSRSAVGSSITLNAAERIEDTNPSNEWRSRTPSLQLSAKQLSQTLLVRPSSASCAVREAATLVTVAASPATMPSCTVSKPPEQKQRLAAVAAADALAVAKRWAAELAAADAAHGPLGRSPCGPPRRAASAPRRHF